MKNSRELGELKTVEYKGKQRRKSTLYRFLSERENLVSLQKPQHTEHDEAGMQRAELETGLREGDRNRRHDCHSLGATQWKQSPCFPPPHIP